jgi:hypothetical protein
MNGFRKLLWIGGVMLGVISGLAWFSYVSYGVAYGDLVGIPGREHELIVLSRNALTALRIALGCEVLAVGLVSWLLMALDQKAWIRLSISVAFAGVADLLTLGFIRP